MERGGKKMKKNLLMILWGISFHNLFIKQCRWSIFFFFIFSSVRRHSFEFFLFSLPSFMHYNYSDSIVCLFYCLSRFFFSNNNNNNVPSADTHLNVPSLCTELVLENFVYMYKKEMFGFHPLSVSLSFTTDAFDRVEFMCLCALASRRGEIYVWGSHIFCVHLFCRRTRLCFGMMNPRTTCDDEAEQWGKARKIIIKKRSGNEIKILFK